MHKRYGFERVRIVPLLVLIGTSVAGAAPMAFDAELGIATDRRSSSSASIASIGRPLPGRAEVGFLPSVPVTGSLRVSLGSLAPLVFPHIGSPKASVSTTAGIVQGFVLPSFMFSGTQTVPGTTSVFGPMGGLGLTGLRFRAFNGSISGYPGVGCGGLALYFGSFSDLARLSCGPGAGPQIGGAGALGYFKNCWFGTGTFGSPCRNPLVTTNASLSVNTGTQPIGPISADTLGALRFTTGVAMAGVFSASGTRVAATATGSRSGNTLSLVAPIVINGAGTQFELPGVVRLNLTFQVPGTTTTTLPPGGGDVRITGKKLIIIDKLSAASKAKVVFVAKDDAVTKGGGTDPTQIDAVFDYQIQTFGASGSAALPQGASWVGNKDTVAKYVNKDAPTGGAVKVGVIKPGKLLKVVMKDLGDSGSEIDVFQGGATTSPVFAAVQLTVTNGATTVQHCAEFEECVRKLIAGDTGAKVVCKTPVPSTFVICN